MIDMATYWMQVALLLWLGAALLFVFRDVVAGCNRARGLLRRPGGRRADPERVLLFFATLAVALTYGLEGLARLGAPAGGEVTMPDLPLGLVLALGGAQGTYVIGKILRNFIGDRS
ncbi:MAG: hypothetical protein AAF761_06515 [Pseudomonadota bacterium]